MRVHLSFVSSIDGLLMKILLHVARFFVPSSAMRVLVVTTCQTNGMQSDERRDIRIKTQQTIVITPQKEAENANIQDSTWDS